MTHEKTKIECLKCGQELEASTDESDSQRLPCPECGSLSRRIKLYCEAGMSVHTQTKTNAKHGQSGPPFITIKSGDDLFRKTGEWNTLERVIDHEKNEYHEIITDPRTGKIIKETHEPLSSHRGHGSAKRKEK